jgi:hypothetical protein
MIATSSSCRAGRDLWKPVLLLALIHPSAWKRRYKKFGGGVLVMVMLHFGWLLGGEDFWGRCDPYIAERAGAVTPRPSLVVVCFTSF